MQMIAFPSKVEIEVAMRNQVCYKSTILRGGAVVFSGTRPIYYTGGYACVFKFRQNTGTEIAVKCWFADIVEAQKRTQTIKAYLSSLNSRFFVKELSYIENALLIEGYSHPAVIMNWESGLTLKDYLNEDINNKQRTLQLASKFLEMVRFFHAHSIAHGDLQHGNIKVRNDETLLVLDYDSMYVSGLEGLPDVIKGLAGYQHPARFNSNTTIHSKLDYFSELVIYLSLLVFAEHPSIWPQYYETEDLLFSQYDYGSPTTSRLLQDLLSSSNSRIKNLAERLLGYLQENDISKLKPLEAIIQEDFGDMVQDISGQW